MDPSLEEDVAWDEILGLPGPQEPSKKLHVEKNGNTLESSVEVEIEELVHLYDVLLEPDPKMMRSNGLSK